ncbi:DUF4136 domain-containing protein [Altererythrobacter xixiisoli]|uniref:DUF4136 domain-containing protein n=1 Tax=Croceibacterium xixiisoli TaxID=1476466 RepID=A0A6I4TPH2_9SPHN|nr:DUF4136 domain-containing protein [Croceibacterium xixiisoli]MXO97834.1 DUF4136 domain-containing protein [Croceibacterium xixiisoli]
MRIITVLAPLALLGGCATSYVSPVEVTRFTGDAPNRLSLGTIAVRAAPGQPGDSLEFSAYQNAVAAELGQLGYRVVPLAQAAQVAELRVGRSVAQPQRGRGPVSVGVGGSTGSFGSGLGLGLGLDLSGRPKDRIDTEMGVAIRDNGNGQTLWEGRASFSASADNAYADRQQAANRLADALFSGFPGQSGETIQVK